MLYLSDIRFIGRKVFWAESFLLLYAFLLVSGLHLKFRVLNYINIEVILLVCGLFLTAMKLHSEPPLLTRAHEGFLVLCCLLLGTPLLSSLCRGDHLRVVGDWEYRSWAKSLLFAPALLLVFKGGRARWLLGTVMGGAFAFGCVVLYRFFVLGEAREFDLRPTLHIKNGDPNFFCLIFSFLTPLSIFLLNETARAKRTLLALCAGACTALFLFCALLSESRVGVIGVVIALLILVKWVEFGFSKRGFVITLSVGACLSIWHGDNRIFERLLSPMDESALSRLVTFRAGLEAFKQNPVLGNGWASSQQFYLDELGVVRFHSAAKPLSVHNAALQTLAEMGLYGFTLYTLLILFTATTIVSGLQRSRNLAVCSLASLFILCLNSTTLPIASKDFVIFFLALLTTLNSASPPTLRTAQL